MKSFVTRIILTLGISLSFGEASSGATVNDDFQEVPVSGAGIEDLGADREESGGDVTPHKQSSSRRLIKKVLKRVRGYGKRLYDEAACNAMYYACRLEDDLPVDVCQRYYDICMGKM